jgi:CubicO group peptidase (beta-lactamase class C family)
MIENQILSPLKMNETFTDIPSALSSKNISTPHGIENGKTTPLQFKDYGIYKPAAGIYSNVIDLAKWIKLQLSNGTFENSSIINSETLASMQKPQNIAIDLFKEYFNPEAIFMTVGMGWFISDYKGLKVIQMGGLSSGTSNLITIVPSKKIGIIISANKAGAFESFAKINYKVFNDLIIRY